jgi:hypothetical protein
MRLKCKEKKRKEKLSPSNLGHVSFPNLIFFFYSNHPEKQQKSKVPIAGSRSKSISSLFFCCLNASPVLKLGNLVEEILEVLILDLVGQ